MEDLWKLTCIDYRIAAIAERSAYDEIVRRYRTEEVGCENNSSPEKAAPGKRLSKK